MSAVTTDPDLAAVMPASPPPAESQPAVLVIDDSQVCRDTVCKILVENGFAVLTAGDGESGLAQLAEHPCVMILLDNEMPKMNGLAFLKALRADPRWAGLPVVMLTTSSAKAVIVEAIKFKIAGYVLKERLAMPELIQRVKSAIKQSQPVVKAPPVPINVPNLVQRDTVLAGIASSEAIKTLAGVVKQIAAIVESSKSSLAEISGIVRQDPVMAARVIQLATSSAYAGTRSRMASVDDAVRIVGVNAVKELVLGFGVYSAFPDKRGDGIGLLRCWQHSFAVAAILSRIVPKTDGVAPGLPYLIGLCHDLAEICLRQKYPTEFTAAEDFAIQSGVPTASLLPQVFGVTYAELTQSLLERLKFPAQACDPINELHRAQPGSSIESYKGVLARSLAIANMMAHGMLLTSSVDSLVSPVPLVDCRSSLIPSAAMNVAEIQSEAVTTVYILADLAADQEESLSKSLYNRRDSTVLYLRHPSLAHLDPLETALKSLAKVEVRDKLPSHEEWSEFDGVIAVAPQSQDPLFLSATRLNSQLPKSIPMVKLSATPEPPPGGGPVVTDATPKYPLPIKDLAQFVSTLSLRA